MPLTEWKYVPVTMTEEMFDALCGTPWIIECTTHIYDNKVVTINKEFRDQRYAEDGWIAMLAAAPTPVLPPPNFIPMTEDDVFKNEELMSINGELSGLSMTTLMLIVRAVEKHHINQSQQKDSSQ